VLPVFLVNTTMETYFQKGTQPAGALEQDDRLPADSLIPGKAIDNTQVTGTESCVGCHYSAGIAVGFKKDAQGNDQIVDGHKVPIYGENGHFGKTGNGNFSWMLQIEASSVSEPNPPPLKTKSGVQPNAQP
jgi:mono/diheme cytochrome c family protein